MGGVAIGIQASPDISCLVVGAVRIVIDVSHILDRLIYSTDPVLVACRQIYHLLQPTC